MPRAPSANCGFADLKSMQIAPFDCGLRADCSSRIFSFVANAIFNPKIFLLPWHVFSSKTFRIGRDKIERKISEFVNAKHQIPRIEDYEPLVGSETVGRILKKARTLEGFHVANI